jgi:hypothetical protein
MKMIKKTKSGYEVVSHTTGRNLGKYKTKKEAEERLRQIKYFGKKK